MDLTDLEIEMLDDLLTCHGTDMYHHPDNYEQEEWNVHSELTEKVRRLAKERKLWWAV